MGGKVPCVSGDSRAAYGFSTMRERSPVMAERRTGRM
jgi:hypothetical protein